MCLFYFFRMVIVLYRRRPKANQRDDEYFADDRLYTTNIFDSGNTSTLLEGDDFFSQYDDGVPKTVTDTRGPKLKNNLASKKKKNKKSFNRQASDRSADFRTSSGDRASMGKGNDGYREGVMNEISDYSDDEEREPSNMIKL